MKSIKAYIALVLGLALIMLAVYTFPKIEYNAGLSTLSSKHDKEFQRFELYKSKFSRPKESLTLLLSIEDPITYNDLKQLKILTDKLGRLKHIKKIQSIVNLKIPQRTIFGQKMKEVLNLSSQASFQRSWQRLDKMRDIRNKFVGKDEKNIAIYMQSDDPSNKQLFFGIKEILNREDYAKWYLLGSKISRQEVNELTESDLRRISLISISLMMVVFFLFFRDIRALLITVFMLGLNVSFGIVMMYVLDIDFTALTISIPLLIAVLSFTDIIHIIFYNKKKESKDPVIARELKVPILLTSLTTFLAFALFLLSGVDEIIDFAILACMGIAFNFLTALYVIPALVQLIGLKLYKSAPSISILPSSLPRQKWVFGISLITLVACFVYISDVRINHYTNEDKLGHLKEAQVILDEQFGGLRNIEVVIKTKNVFSAQTIREIDKIEQYLKQDYGCTELVSLNTAVKRLNRFENFNIPAYFSIPDTLNASFLKRLEEKSNSLGLSEALSENTIRIVGRIHEIGTDAAMKKNDALIVFLERNGFGEKTFVSGHFFVQDTMIKRVTSIVLIGILLSVIISSLLIGFLFRSVRYAIAILLPNILPLILSIGLIKMLGIALDPFTAMALSILLGLSLDDTIFIVGSYLSGKSTGVELSNSLKNNSIPILSTSSILIAGFGTLVFSVFSANQNIGAIVSIVLVIALFSDLLILPFLLNWANKAK